MESAYTNVKNPSEGSETKLTVQVFPGQWRMLTRFCLETGLKRDRFLELLLLHEVRALDREMGNYRNTDAAYKAIAATLRELLNLDKAPRAVWFPRSAVSRDISQQSRVEKKLKHCRLAIERISDGATELRRETIKMYQDSAMEITRILEERNIPRNSFVNRLLLLLDPITLDRIGREISDGRRSLKNMIDSEQRDERYAHIVRTCSFTQPDDEIRTLDACILRDLDERIDANNARTLVSANPLLAIQRSYAHTFDLYRYAMVHQTDCNLLDDVYDDIAIESNRRMTSLDRLERNDLPIRTSLHLWHLGGDPIGTAVACYLPEVCVVGTDSYRARMEKMRRDVNVFATRDL